MELQKKLYKEKIIKLLVIDYFKRIKIKVLQKILSGISFKDIKPKDKALIIVSNFIVVLLL